MITPLRSNSPARGVSRPGAARTQGTAGASFASGGGATQTAATQAARPMHAAATLDALVALQFVDDPAGRRARVARRGGKILDDLEALKLAILEGRSGRTELERIANVVADARESIDDAGLESLIDAIELRAQVEIAKRER